MGAESVAVMIPIAGIAMVVFIVYFATREKEAKARVQAEAQKQILDKFTSSTELAAFLESPNGRRLLESRGNPDTNPKERILRSVKAGVVLTFLGLGLFALMAKEEDMVFPAVIVFSLGLGFLSAAAISLRLSRKWGLLDEHSEQGSPPVTYSA